MDSAHIRAIFKLDQAATREIREAVEMKHWFEEQIKKSKEILDLAQRGADTELAKKAAEVHAAYTKCLVANAELQKVLKRLRANVDELLAMLAEDKKAEQV